MIACMFCFPYFEKLVISWLLDTYLHGKAVHCTYIMLDLSLEARQESREPELRRIRIAEVGFYAWGKKSLQYYLGIAFLGNNIALFACIISYLIRFWYYNHDIEFNNCVLRFFENWRHVSQNTVINLCNCMHGYYIYCKPIEFYVWT